MWTLIIPPRCLILCLYFCIFVSSPYLSCVGWFGDNYNFVQLPPTSRQAWGNCRDWRWWSRWRDSTSHSPPWRAGPGCTATWRRMRWGPPGRLPDSRSWAGCSPGRRRPCSRYWGSCSRPGWEPAKRRQNLEVEIGMRWIRSELKYKDTLPRVLGLELTACLVNFSL